MIPFIVLFCVISNGHSLTCSLQGDRTADCRSLDLQSIPSHLKSSITHLNMRDNNLTELNPGDLQFYPNITELDLSYNHLSRIQPGVFMGMSSIERLELVGNKLNYCNDSLPKNAFDGLVSLRKLLLYEQNSTQTRVCPAYPYGTFSFTPQLQYLGLSVTADTLPPVPIDIVDLEFLHTLEFRRGNINFISTDSLAPLSHSSVTSLVFTFMGLLQGIQNGTFKAIPSLETIVLNRVWDITPSAFMAALDNIGSMNIKNIHLHISAMTQSEKDLPLSLFCNDIGRNLERVSLSVLNFDKPINLRLLECLVKVQEISIMYSDYNNVIFHQHKEQKIQFTFFAQFEHLKVLNLFKLDHSGQEYHAYFIHCLQKNNRGCSREVEDFFAPSIQYTPRYNLEHSDASSRINKTLTSIYITEWGTGCLPLENAIILKLDALKNTQIIDMHQFSLLCNTGWMDTDGGMSGLYQLRYLNLSDNGLTSLPRIQDASNLEVLDVSKNRLGLRHSEGWSLRKEFFWHSSKLIELGISNNRLTELSKDVLNQWPVMEILELADNRLTKITFLTHGSGDQLTYVDLSENSLSKLEDKDIKHLKQFERNSFAINLKNNPFVCVCALKETAIWLISTKVNVQDKDEYICNNNQTINVTKLDIHNLCPSSLILLL